MIITMGSVLTTQQKRSRPATVVVEELAGFPDVWDICLRLARLPHVLLFDSAGLYPGLGRYSFITADPFDWLCARGRSVVMAGINSSARQADPFTILS